MKKNLLTAAAMMVGALFVSTEIAKAADISFSGQIRTRWEYAEHLNGAGAGTVGSTAAFNDDTNGDDSIASSVRLAATAKVNETTSAFIQLQSNRTWGDSALTTGTSNVGSGSGNGNSSGAANDRDASVGVHQAYFTLKNIALLHSNFELDAKVGRQEIILDGHRLFGNTIWTMGMQTHDAIRMNHNHDNISMSFAYILAQEDGRDTDVNDANDSDVYLAHLNYKGILGGQFSAIYSALLDGCGNGTPTSANNLGCTTGANDIHTVGGRQAGNLFGLDYRGEVYYQWGQANGHRNDTGNAVDSLAVDVARGDTDRDAYMFGLRVGKAFNNTMYKPSVTVWYDYLSGTSDEDQRNGDWKSFNTLFDTGHKFYGLQDLFLGIGAGGSGGTQGLGLQDLAIKFKLNPMPKWTMKLAAHAFATAESVTANSQTTGIATGGRGREPAGGGTVGRGVDNAGPPSHSAYLGHEFDLTLVNKYNANTNIMIGFSNFNGTESFRNLKTVGGVNTTVGSSDANWAYVQFDVKF